MNKYERIEYTPYGEYWIEKRSSENKTLPFKFTGKERDEETGLYYYGARYLDAKTSRWLTADPALGDYIPMAPVNDEAKKHNQNLPGMGGIYNTVNFHLYHYAGNNPIRYTDPDGREIDVSEDTNQDFILKALQNLTDDSLEISDGKVIIKSYGDGTKTSGTKLIRYLITGTDKKIKISTQEPDGTNNSLTQPYKVNENSSENDAFNGKGLNSIIYWSLGEPIIAEIDANGNVSNKNCPVFIALGHELIHAYHNARGENKGSIVYGIYVGREEEFSTKFDSTLSENTLRIENGLNKRYR